MLPYKQLPLLVDQICFHEFVFSATRKETPMSVNNLAETPHVKDEASPIKLVQLLEHLRSSPIALSSPRNVLGDVLL